MSALVQRSPEWLEWRRERIGASDAPIIMGVSPWSTPYRLWEEKVGIQPPPVETPAMRRGSEMEERARECFEKMTCLTVFPRVLTHQDHKWMVASLDGLDIEEKHMVEIKCAGHDDHELAKKGKVPEKYYPQLQHQLEVAGLDMVYYFSFDGDEGVIVEVGRSTKYIRGMIEAEEDFYKCMMNFLPPSYSPRDYVERGDKVWKRAAEEWLDINREIVYLEKKEKKLREELTALTNGSNCCGGGVKVSKVYRRGHIDYSQVPELADVNLEPYRKSPTEFWKISQS